MCVEMVVICKKNQKSSTSTSTSSSVGPVAVQSMSQSTARLSCVFRDMNRWTAAPVVWSPLEASPGHCSMISSLLQDLSLTTAPPTKRQCRSLSCSDNLGQSMWRPQGSGLWTSVKKRRCHSGGSVPLSSSGFTFPLIHRSLSSSLSPPPLCCPPSSPDSPLSSPDSPPWSQSQSCVNDRRLAMKRRRQEETRPSLDLTKMTQKLQSFHSLSCRSQISDSHKPNTFTSALAPLCPAVEVTTPPTHGETVWTRRSSFSALGGELDIEQIERN
ncbi:unnamed protein product [Knipowitschia caucasica]|uniref:Uncharacterized protein n=1 Tax=Knipowitschia caucasica TaxID=637954 RepID=A0AAV2LGN5_KNICA